MCISVSNMSKYDPYKKVALLVDEWGTWWDEEPGTVPGHLYQQNTMRDAMVAALSLNVFNRHTDRVKMANIAQIANVLQSMVLTKGDKMVLTPTYHVFKMYAPHQDATFIPLEVETSVRDVRDGRKVPTVNATASQKDGKVNVTLTNIDLKEKSEVTIPFSQLGKNAVSGEILTSATPNDYNDFDNPDKVKTAPFKGYKITKEGLQVTLPPMSVVALSIAR
ncbi:MAG: alpha-N-arabinofuranosidase, partial [Muribaculaceae bacterium]|nr:alpha-N-arabinofuranosidase [Muribaculaceae bacterium]